MRGLSLLVAALACGCVNVEVARFARMRGPPPAESAAAAPTGRGRSCMTVVVVAPVTGPPSVSAALAQAAGDRPLLDAVVRYELRYLPLLGGRSCYAVEGQLP
jgi:hypothetical protein